MTTRLKITAWIASVCILLAAGIGFLRSTANESARGIETSNTDHASLGEANGRPAPIESHLSHPPPSTAKGSWRASSELTPRFAALRARFLKLAGLDKYGAIDAALRLTGADRDLALATLATAWKTDPRRGYKELAQIIDKIADYARARNPATAAAGLIQALNAISAVPADPELPLLTMRLANRLLEGKNRLYVLNLAAFTYTRVDPSMAFSFGNTLSGTDYEQFVDAFSKGWASQDPEAAAQWASSIGDADMRTRTLANAVNSLARSNPGRAAQWLEALPDSGERQAAIRRLGSTWAQQDTAAALAWAGQLSNPAEQKQGTQAIQAIAPVGVGISLARTNAAGYPVAMELVPTGPAAQGGGVQRGDQIVAVSDPNSQWIGTQNLPMDQVISMIRGTAGQPVQLRLLPAGATDPSQARIVTIVRQQILFKRPQSGG